MKEGNDYRSMVLQYNLVLSAAYVPIAIVWPYFVRQDVQAYLRIEPAEVAAAVLAGVLTQGLAMLLFNSAARRLGSEAMARLSLLGPPLTVATGVLLYSERPTLVQLLALATIVGVSHVARPEADRPGPGPKEGRAAIAKRGGP